MKLRARKPKPKKAEITKFSFMTEELKKFADGDEESEGAQPTKKDVSALVKTSAPEEQPEKRRSKAQMGLVGAAGLSPFGGLVGRQRMIHDPLQGAKGKKFRSMSALGRAAMPGDVLVTTKPEGSAFKRFIAPIGESEFYHAQGVTGRRGGQGTTIDVGYTSGKKSLKAMRGKAHTISELEDYYPDVVLVRPKKKLTAKQMMEFSRQNLLRTHEDPGYSGRKAMEVLGKEVFMPQLGGVTGGGRQQAKTRYDMLPERDALGYEKPGGKLKKTVVCQGNVCSTAPAQALEKSTGQRVLKGKRAQDIFPTDFLRSPEYELVGSRIKHRGQYAAGRAGRVAKGLATRGAIGAGLAGTAYGMTEKPEAAGAAGGALGASMLASGLVKRMKGGSSEAMQKVLPTLETIGGGIVADYPLSTGTAVKRYLTRRAPILAAGGVGGGLLTHHLLKKRREAKSGQSKESSIKLAIGAPLGAPPMAPPSVGGYKPPKPAGDTPQQRLKKSQDIGNVAAFDQKTQGIKLQKFKPLSMMKQNSIKLGIGEPIGGDAQYGGTPPTQVGGPMLYDRPEKVHIEIKTRKPKKESKKLAFTVSQYSGPLSMGRFRARSPWGMPANPGGMKTAGPPPGEEEDGDGHKEKTSALAKAALMAIRAIGEIEEKRAAPMTPQAKLTRAAKVGEPRTTAPPGPSIAQIAKPSGYGKPLPGATKTP